MSRANEVAQGLRHEAGGVVGGLCVEDCVQAQEDFEAGRPPPRMTSASYDIWRARLSRLATEQREFLAGLRAEQTATQARVRALLVEAGRPDLVAEYDARLSEIEAPKTS